MAVPPPPHSALAPGKRRPHRPAAAGAAPALSRGRKTDVGVVEGRCWEGRGRGGARPIATQLGDRGPPHLPNKKVRMSASFSHTPHTAPSDEKGGSRAPRNQSLSSRRTLRDRHAYLKSPQPTAKAHASCPRLRSQSKSPTT